MLQIKDIKNLSELKTTFVDRHKKSEFFSEFIEILNIGKFHGIFSSAKQKGISALILIHILLTFPFIDQKNIYSFIHSYWNQFAGFGKDAYYRLKNNSKIKWRGFLFGVAKLIIENLEKRSNQTSDKKSGIKAFIFDDTTIAKTGYKIEGVSRVWNHVMKKSILGFQLLVMGFYDGTMFMPINFSFHREKGKNKKKPYNLSPKHFKKQFKKKRVKGTAGAERKKELDVSKISSAIKMINQSIKQNIKADYILTDSWFTCWEMVQTALNNSLKYIGMFSKVKTLFTYRGKKHTYKAIRKLNRKNIKRNKRFNLYYIRTVVEWNGQNIVLYCTRKGKRGNWKTLLSTDLSANFTETLEIYQIRWTIEVFFKESKQMLELGKSQSKDFDAQIADTTTVMVQYLFLALKNQIEQYESLGALFKNTKADTLEIKLHERLLRLLVAIIEIIGNLFEQVDSDEILSKIINDEKSFEQIQLIINPQKCNYKNAA